MARPGFRIKVKCQICKREVYHTSWHAKAKKMCCRRCHELCTTEPIFLHFAIHGNRMVKITVEVKEKK